MDVEHVQPVQSLTPDPASRSRTLLAVAVPIALLVGVVATGALGRSSIGPGPDERPEVAVAEVIDEQPTARPSPTVPGLPQADELVANGFPSRIIGLDVRSVAQTLEGLDGGSIGHEAVAIAGWMTVPAAGRCREAPNVPDLPVMDLDLLCQRETFLSDDGLPLFAMEENGLTVVRMPQRHLRPQAMPGVELVSILTRQFLGYSAELRPRRVVIVGRFGDPRLYECRNGLGSCTSTFAIERLIWMDGEPQVRRTERYPGLANVQLSGKVRWHIVDGAMQHGAIVLSEMVVPRGELVRFDPDADRVVPGHVTGTVWYVRTLLRTRSYGSVSGEVGWAVIEDATGFVLAGEPDGRSAWVR